MSRAAPLPLALTYWTADHPSLLIVGPSLGTSIATLWGECAALLTEQVDVVGWDLPGHGRSAPTDTRFGIGDLADTVTGIADDVAAGRPVWYAGVSLGGAVGLELSMRPDMFSGIAAVAAGPRFGEPANWTTRADLVRRAGTPVMVAGAAQRWFAPGFIDRRPDTAAALLTALSDADPESYSLACEALAAFDLRNSLDRRHLPVWAMPGEHDGVITPDQVTGLPGTVLAGCGHLPPAERPDLLARTLLDLIGAHPNERTENLT